MSIRWRKKDEKLLRSTVRNYNAKINRILKKEPSAREYLPEKVSVDEIKEMIDNRADFNRNINRLKRFSRRGAEKPILFERGLKVTEYEYKEAKILQRVSNRKRKKVAKKVSESYVSDTGRKPIIGTSLEEMNEAPVKYDFKRKTQKTFRKAFQNLLKETKSSYESERVRKYKEDYLNNIRKHLGYGTIANLLYETVSKISAETMYYSYYDDTTTQLQFLSDPLAVDFIGYNAYVGWCNVTGQTPIELEQLEGNIEE